MPRFFGYKENGEACLFDLAEGEPLPGAWSGDVTVIADPEKRTGDAITKASGSTIMLPVTPPSFDIAPEAPEAPQPPRRRPGRPPRVEHKEDAGDG